MSTSNSINILVADDWTDYELIDSGDEEKLERFGAFMVVRPEPKAIWKKSHNQAIWSQAAMTYHRNNEGGGKWQYNKRTPPSWTITWHDLTFIVKPTGFKHMGVFPEQAAIWKWIHNKIKSAHRPISVLNLFAYTGGSTLAAASADASVTHLDSAREIITWANENVEASGLGNKSIRWMPEDALTFVKREIKRGRKYDAIILDPPKFGRGNKNEVWKIEKDLPRLLDQCKMLLSSHPLFILINAYAVSYSSITLGDLLSQMTHDLQGTVNYGELATKQTATPLLLPNSIYATWVK